MSTIKVVQNKQRIKKDGAAPVYISFYLNSEKVVIPCKVSVPTKKFDEKSGLMRGTTPEARDTNLIITKVKSTVNDILVRSRLRGINLNKEAFIREYNNPSDYKSFHEFVKSYQRIKARELELGTYAHHKCCMKKFQEYCPALQFHELTTEFLKDYFYYMKRTLDNADSTAYRNMSTIKIYVTAALKKGYMEKDPFDDFRIKRIKSNIDYLTEEELSKFVQLYHQHSLPERFHVSLRFFLFMCFTSLHISDARAVTIDQISNGILTYYRIKNRNSKPEPIKIPLPIPALNIIKEAMGERQQGRVFSNIQCDQVINRQIKEIAKILEINKSISAKTGRHSFATIFLRKTKDVATLQKLLGHSNLKETMIYAHVIDESMYEGIQCFNEF